MILLPAVVFLEGGQLTLCVMLNMSKLSFSGIDMVKLLDILFISSLSWTWRDAPEPWRDRRRVDVLGCLEDDFEERFFEDEDFVDEA